MRVLKIAGAAVALIIVIAVLVMVIGIPSSFLTSSIQARVERETGYRLTIAGSTRLGLWPSLNVTLNDVTLENPRDPDISDRLDIGSIQADIRFSSLWSETTEITEIVIDHPVLSVPLLRERIASRNATSRGVVTSTEAEANGGGNVTIDHVTVTEGAMVFSNVRDRVTNRIDAINASAVIGSDRNIRVTGNARGSSSPIKFVIKATPPAPPLDRQNIPVEMNFEAPGFSKDPLQARAEVRLNGSVVMINGVSGSLGDGAFNGWASVDTSSKPLVKLDLDFQRVDFAKSTAAPGGGASLPWSNVPIDLSGMNYVDMQAKISAAEINFGQARVAPVAIDASLASGVMRVRLSNLGAFGGQANGDLIVDATSVIPTYALRGDLTNVRALPLMQNAFDFDRLDGKLQAKLSLLSAGASQRAIMSNLDGSVFAVFQDGQIRGINVAQMIRQLTASPLSGWQDDNQQATDLSQLSASFRIEKGKATSTDLNLVGPLVRVTGAGTIDLGEKTLAMRTEPKLVLTTQGQGRAADPVGLGIPVVIQGSWAAPQIYPEMAGILDNPDAAYAKLKEMGKGLFGSGGGLGNLLGGNTQGGNTQNGNGSATGALGGLLGGSGSDSSGSGLGQSIGNMIQQGLGRMRQGQNRSLPGSDSATTDIPPATPPLPSLPAQGDAAAQGGQESQPMNDVLKQLFNR